MKFSYNEAKEVARNNYSLLRKPTKKYIKNILSDMNINKIYKMNNVKLSLKFSNEVVIVEYAYLEKKYRGKGYYKKTMNELKLKYTNVLYEPTLKWFLDNYLKPTEEIGRITYGDYKVRSYFIWGTKKTMKNLENIVISKQISLIENLGKSFTNLLSIGVKEGVEIQLYMTKIIKIFNKN